MWSKTGLNLKKQSSYGGGVLPHPAPPVKLKTKPFVSPGIASRIEKMNQKIISTPDRVKRSRSPHTPPLSIQKRMANLAARRNATLSTHPPQKVQIPNYAGGGFAEKLKRFQRLTHHQSANSGPSSLLPLRDHKTHPFGPVKDANRKRFFNNQARQNKPFNKFGARSQGILSGSQIRSRTPSLRQPPIELKGSRPNYSKASASKSLSMTSDSDPVLFSPSANQNLGLLMLSPDWDADYSEDDDDATIKTPVVCAFRMNLLGDPDENIDSLPFLPPVPVYGKTDSLRFEDFLDEDRSRFVEEFTSEEDLLALDVQGLPLPEVYLSEVVMHLLSKSFQSEVEYVMSGNFEIDLFPRSPTLVGSCNFYGMQIDAIWFKVSRKPIVSTEMDGSSKLLWDGEVRGVYAQVYGDVLLDPCCGYKRERKRRNAIQKTLDRSRTETPDGIKSLARERSYQGF